jgi:hypothetical protein
MCPPLLVHAEAVPVGVTTLVVVRLVSNISTPELPKSLAEEVDSHNTDGLGNRDRNPGPCRPRPSRSRGSDRTLFDRYSLTDGTWSWSSRKVSCDSEVSALGHYIVAVVVTKSRSFVSFGFP